MDINKVTEQFSVVEDYATLMGRKAMLFYKMKNLFYGIKEYKTYVEKIEEHAERKDIKVVTLRFANNAMQEVWVDINDNIQEKTIVYSLGYFIYFVFGGTYYTQISKFNSFSMTDKCNTLKAYNTKENLELSEAKEPEGYSDWYIYKIRPLTDTGLYYRFDTILESEDLGL